MILPTVPVLTKPFALVGGENLTAAPLSIQPGELLASQNYECVAPQGYRRIDGNERFDGRPKPSAASYWKLGFDAGTAAIAVTNIVTGATSGASGEALVVTLTSGSWAGGDAAGYLILFNVSGTFQDNENLQVSAATKAVANGIAYERGASNDTDDATWLQAAIEATRADIGTVRGSGRILGVWAYNGTKYAFRNNGTGGAAGMWKSSATGWTNVGVGFELAFTSGGTTPIAVSDTITGHTSGATAVVSRVVLASGSWAGGDAAGTLYLSSQTGSFQVENVDVGASLDLATIAGDSVMVLGYELAFTSGGTTEIVAGNTVTGATSAATGVVGRVIVTSGTWAEGDAAGRIILTSQSGTFQSENLDVGASLNLATIAADSDSITLAPSGYYEFLNYNFYASAASIRMYGCDGENRAFEFDGTVFTFITSETVPDTPTHIAEYQNHLFLGFSEGSAVHSGTGDPITFEAIVGASEIGIGDRVVGFASLPDALAIYGRNETGILYGSSTLDWNMTSHSKTSGAVEWTVQNIGKPVYLDDPGLTDLQAVQAYGNFADNAFSEKIQPLLKSKISLACSSVSVRNKSQYRIFFTDNSGIICTFNKGKLVGFTRVDYGLVVRCACSVEDSSGNEELFFGSDDGYVYQMDSGTSFDGSAVTAFGRIPFYHYGNSRQKKRFRKIVIDIDAPSGATLSFVADFDYGGSNMPSGDELSLNVLSGGGYWDENAIWGDFTWDAQIVGQAQGYINGTGVNMSISFHSVATYEAPHTLQGAVIHYSPRGLER
jgi:hypothetical protein